MTGTPVEPILGRSSTIVDLLDRVLDKGLVINADIIITVAGIPLIGVNLRAALAGMETMIQYGVMRDWDDRTRASKLEEARTRARATEERPAALEGRGEDAGFRRSPPFLPARSRPSRSEMPVGAVKIGGLGDGLRGVSASLRPRRGPHGR